MSVTIKGEDNSIATKAEDEELLTTGEVARIFRVGESTVRKWVSAGSVPFLMLPGGDYRIPQKQLFRGIKSNFSLQVLESVQAKLSRVGDADIAAEIDAARSSRRSNS